MGTKIISMRVPECFEFKGSEVLKELDDFFHFLYERAGADQMMRDYWKWDSKIKPILEGWKE